MKVTVIDLELNQPSEKIIQLGAVIGDVDTGALVDSYEVLINPGEPISADIVTLTGIRDDMIQQNSVSLPEAFRGLKRVHEKHQSLSTLLQWGVYDTLLLRNQLFQNNDLKPQDWVFGRRWIDVKALFQAQCIVHNQKIYAGLKKAMKRVGLTFEGRAHSAAADATNTFLLFVELGKRFKGSPHPI